MNGRETVISFPGTGPTFSFTAYWNADQPCMLSLGEIETRLDEIAAEREWLLKARRVIWVQRASLRKRKEANEKR